MYITVKSDHIHKQPLILLFTQTLNKIDSLKTSYHECEWWYFVLQVQYYENDGNCGVCGDNYADPRPRNNENTGQYGTGAKVAIYEAGSVITVRVNLTANHRGTFTFR